MTTFLFSKVAIYSLEKRIVPVHKPFSQSDAFYRVTRDWENFPTYFPSAPSESE